MQTDSSEATVFIVDDDSAIRDSMSMLMKTIGLKSQSFSSAKLFLEHYDPAEQGCLVLDVRMPGMSGLELQEALNERQAILPVIFITGHGDVPMAVDAIKNGAADFIQKPFRDQDLIDRINMAIENDQKFRSQLTRKQELKERFESLTPREKEVLNQVVNGSANKVAAHELGVSQRTIEIHRSRVMEKMQARSVAQLVKMYMTLSQH